MPTPDDTGAAGADPGRRNELAMTAGELQAACRLIALLLGQPDGESRSILGELAEAHPWLRDGAREIEGLSLERWQAEHTRLFVSGHPRTPCPPFESHYRHGHPGGPSASVREIEDIYRRAGLETSGPVPADYLGTLLECAAWLIERTGGSCGLLAELWVGHLALWAPRFASDLMSASRLELYRALGRRLDRLLPMVRAYARRSW